MTAARRSYGTGRLYTRADRNGRETWYGKWQVNGRRVNRKVGPKRAAGGRDGLTRAQAEAQLRRLIAEVQVTRPVAETLTIAAAGARYARGGRLVDPGQAERIGVRKPVRLPNARQAHIPTGKLVRYALDPSQERGKHEARVFASALGIAAADWRYLHDAILAALPEAAVRSTRITPFGVTYEVVAMVDGLNGAMKPVVTTWIIEGDGSPRLTSIWVDVP